MMKMMMNKKLIRVYTAFFIVLHSFRKCKRHTKELPVYLSSLSSHTQFADVYQKIENKYKPKLGKIMLIRDQSVLIEKNDKVLKYISIPFYT